MKIAIAVICGVLILAGMLYYAPRLTLAVMLPLVTVVAGIALFDRLRQDFRR